MSMKLLAFSDWRIQPLDTIAKIVETEKPDAILYAGDDLRRFQMPSSEICLVSKKRIIRFKYPELTPLNPSQKRFTTNRFIEKLRAIIAEDESLGSFKTINSYPFLYVNGNDDIAPELQHGGTYAPYIESYELSEKGLKIDFSSGKLRIRKVRPKIIRRDVLYLDESGSIRFLGEEESEKKFSIAVPWRDHSIKSKYSLKIGSEIVSVYGVLCTYGLQSDIVNTPDQYTDIVLSHIPPHGMLDLSIRFGANHIGSKKLLRAIIKYEPKIVICGHSHIWGGETAYIGKTLVVNISSDDQRVEKAHYMTIDTNTWNLKVNKIEDPSLTKNTIRGVSTIAKKIFEETGNSDFTTKSDRWHKISLDSLISKAEELGIGTTRIKQRIESLNWAEPRIFKSLSINPTKPAYVDVETGLSKGYGSNPGKLWLIGLLFLGKVYQFFVPRDSEQFLNFLSDNQITKLICWTLYDRNSLWGYFGNRIDKITFIDACKRIANCVDWHTYRLDELYKAFFKEESILSPIKGVYAGLYADHLFFTSKNCLHCPPKEDLKERIIERNKQDLLKMNKICEYVWSKSPFGRKSDRVTLYDLAKKVIEENKLQ